MDADHPYELAVADGGPLVEIPIQWALDDWEQYCFVPEFSGVRAHREPRQGRRDVATGVRRMRGRGGCFVLTNHPFLSGRPSRAAALEGLIEYVCSHDDVWVTTWGPSPSTCAGWG